MLLEEIKVGDSVLVDGPTWHMVPATVTGIVSSDTFPVRVVRHDTGQKAILLLSEVYPNPFRQAVIDALKENA